MTTEACCTFKSGGQRSSREERAQLILNIEVVVHMELTTRRPSHLLAASKDMSEAQTMRCADCL